MSGGGAVALGDGLQDCPVPLAEAHDAGLFDLDGVLYVGPHPVPHAAVSVQEARRQGLRPAFVTNNASRSPGVVAAHLTELGIPAQPQDVVTSAQAAARVLAGLVPAGSAVLVVGTDALLAEVGAVGLVPVRRLAEAGGSVAAVAQGLSPDLRYEDLAEATVALRAGAVWVAGNADSTYPSPRGPLPGNGALVAALAAATGRQPVVAGKPEPALHRASVERVGAVRPLVVGDRLETDVLGAVRGGAPSLLVLTGVVDEAELFAAPRGCRPAYVAPDLRGLLEPQPPVLPDGDHLVCGGARVAPDGSVLAPGSAVELLRARCARAWRDADARSAAR